MDKKKLLEKGLTEEQAKEVLELVKTEYVDKTLLEQKTTELTALQKQLTERDNQIKSLKKFEGDNEALQKKLTEMEETNKAKTDEYNSTLLLERKKNAVKFALLEDEAGKPYDATMVAGMFNLDTINLNEDGTIANGFKEQNEALRKNKAFLFSESSDKGTKRFGTTPPDGKDKPPVTDTPESFGARLAQTQLQMNGITAKEK